jgi:hypothetical protein
MYGSLIFNLLHDSYVQHGHNAYMYVIRKTTALAADYEVAFRLLVLQPLNAN